MTLYGKSAKAEWCTHHSAGGSNFLSYPTVKTASSYDVGVAVGEGFLGGDRVFDRRHLSVLIFCMCIERH